MKQQQQSLIIIYLFITTATILLLCDVIVWKNNKSQWVAEAFVVSPQLINTYTSTLLSSQRRQDHHCNDGRHDCNDFFTITSLQMAATNDDGDDETNNNNNNNNNDNNKSLSLLSNDEISRYSRHLVLNDVGMDGQEKLKKSSVLVIGAGGLGSPCLLYLAAAGIGNIGIVDADIVDTSNLQRQVIHGTSTVGMSKCQSAKQRINDINPYVNVHIYEKEFTSQTAMSIINDNKHINWDVIIDGSDNFPTKYLINDICDIMNISWIYSAILAFEGQISTFNYPPNVGPTYRDLLPTPPSPGDVPSCAEGGVLGVLPGTMGCLQATEAIKLILGHTDGLLSGRVLIFDALQMKFKEVTLNRIDDDKRDVITELIDYQGFCAGPKLITPPKEEKSLLSEKIIEKKPVSQQMANGVSSDGTTTEKGPKRTMDENEDDENDKSSSSSLSTLSYNIIEPKNCLKKLINGWSPYVLDVRLQTEHNIISLPFTDKVVPHRLVHRSDIPKNGDILVYCKAGVRGKKAIEKLINDNNNDNDDYIDPTRFYNLNGGIMKWQKDIDPTMPRY